MHAPRRLTTSLVLLALWAATPAFAESALDYLPADALGFAVVHNLSAANAKIEKLVKIFDGISESAPPAPLAFIKAATGIGDGLDEQGDAVLALLAGAHGAADPRPLLLAPISDYSKFAASISGDATGEICRVTIAGEEVLVARRGGYALLMNVEHRPTMETLLAIEPQATTLLKPLTEWLATNDFAVVLTRSGVEAVTALGNEAVAEQRAAMQEQLGDPAFADIVKDNQNWLEFCETMLGFGAGDVHSAGFGVAIDDATNLRVTHRLAFVPGGAMASLGDVSALAQSPFTSYAAEPFVVAFGGPTPAEWIERLSGAIRRVMEKFPEEYGFENFEKDQWQRVEDSWKANMQGVRGTSSIVQVGEKGDALISNIYSVTKVEDSQAYLKSSRQASELWNELLAESTSDLADKMKYELEDVEVAGKPALKMTVDVAAAAADERVPMLAPMFQSIFGEDGKLNIHIIAADATTVVAGAAAQERLVKTVDQAIAGEMGLADSAPVQTTVKMFEAGAPWQAIVSPQGCVAWVKRLFEHVFAQLGGGAGGPEIPEYPDSPPVGFSANFVGDQLHAEMVWPVATLESLAAYIKTCMGK